MIFNENKDAVKNESICEYFSSHEDKKDLWVIYEVINNAKPFFTSFNEM
jgi:hypothetical protein